MKGRIRIAAAGLVVMTVLTAMTATAALATPAVVPNVTTVHTGEFWSGSLPIILPGVGLASALLIGRRRIVAVARSINPLTRRRASQ